MTFDKRFDPADVVRVRMRDRHRDGIWIYAENFETFLRAKCGNTEVYEYIIGAVGHITAIALRARRKTANFKTHLIALYHIARLKASNYIASHHRNASKHSNA